jgi:hypothetical protein
MATWASDGTPADIQDINDNDAAAGDVITMPGSYASPQSFTWTSGVSLDAGVSLQGGGSGRVVARSLTSVTVGTGTKNFTLVVSTKLPVIEALKSGITVGATLKVERTGGKHVFGSPAGRLWMIGTVNSYNSGTGALEMNITSTSGTGTQSTWYISTIAATTIVKNFSGDAVRASEHTTYSTEISGIRFEHSGSGSGEHIESFQTSGGEPVMVHDCYFEIIDGMFAWRTSSTRGLCWNCSFVAQTLTNGGQGINVKTIDAEALADDDLNSWINPSTWGTLDTTGKLNFYVEDCDYHAFQNGNDFSDNARGVVRYCLFNNASTCTHGSDTAFFGHRHSEVYENEFVFNGYADGQTIDVLYFILLRGGSMYVWGNLIPDIYSTDFNFRNGVTLQQQQMVRNAGPNGLWGDNLGVSTITANTAANPTVITTSGAHGYTTGQYVRIKDSNSTPSINGRHQITVTDATHFTIAVNVTGAGTAGSSKRIYYPCPRQVSLGRVTGSGVDGKDRSTDPNAGQSWPGTYVGDTEPTYFDDNTVVTTLSIGLSGGSPDTSTYPDLVADYIIEDRDYFRSAKPGYTPYQYPNPNRTDLAGESILNVVTMNVGMVNGP